MDEKDQKKYIVYLKQLIDTLNKQLKNEKRKNRDLENQIKYYKSKIK
jgi:hypothetical protein